MKILFLCTANSCRSILCEAMFNHLAPAEMHSYSAGSQPKGEVHPLSLKTLNKAGVSTAGLYSKSSEVHENLAPDFVITVCDKAAGDACPVFSGLPPRPTGGWLTHRNIKGLKKKSRRLSKSLWNRSEPESKPSWLYRSSS